MATLYFKVSSDWEQVVRLREEIKKLENQLRSFGKSTPEQDIRKLETQLATAKQQMTGMVTEAAKAGAVMESDFKKKIYDASQVVNDFSTKITVQRGTIRQLQNELTTLKERYREAVKTNGDTSGMPEQIKALSLSLREQKDALFNLTQQQATARLSVKKLRDEYALFKQDGGDVKMTVDGMSSSMRNWAATIAGGMGIKEFLGQIIQVRGEFENIETSLRVLLGGDTERLGRLLKEMKEYALISPLTTKDMASAMQMMIGFGIQAEDAMTYLKALGDISMGNTVHFNSLALAFSQMSAAGKLMGQDLNQMINAGFNPLQQISEKTGKSIGELKDEMSKGAISAQMVQQAFIDATSEGGKFYGMATEGAKTINGQISMLQESMDNMFNDMGQASQGAIVSAIQLTTKLVENYEAVGKVLISLVAAYGTYKAALIANTALELARNKALLVTIKNTKLAIAVQTAFNNVVKKHPLALIASLAIGAATAIYNFTKRTEEASIAQETMAKINSQAASSIQEEKTRIETLNEILHDNTKSYDERKNALDSIKSTVKDYHADLTTEGELINDNTEAINKYIDAQMRAAKVDALKSGISSSYSKVSEAATNLKQKFDNTSILGFNVTSDKDKERNRKWLEEFLKDPTKYAQTKEDGTFQVKILGSYYTKDMVDDNEEAKALIEAMEEYSTINNLYKDILEEDSTALEAPIKYKEAFNAAKKEYEEAQKALEQITKSSTATEEEYINAQKRFKDAKKKYSSLGGDTTSDAQLKAERKAGEMLVELRREKDQAYIDAMQDGTQKKIAQIVHDYMEQMSEVDRQEAKLRELNKKSGEKGIGEDGLTDEQRTELGQKRASIEQKTDKAIDETYDSEFAAEEKAMNEYLKKYGDYQQKRQAIAEEYEQKIAAATNEWDKKLLEKERDSIFSDLDFEAAKTTSAISQLFGDMKNKTLKDLEEIAKRGEAALEFLKGGEWNEEQGIQLGISKEQFETLSKSPEKLEAISKALGNVKDKAEDLRNPLELVAEGLKEIFNSGDDASLIKGFENLQRGLQGMLKMIGFLSDSISELGESFGSDLMKNISEGLNVAMDTASSTLQGAQAGQSMGQGIAQLVGSTSSMFGPIGAAAGAAVSLVSSLASAIAKIHDKKNEKRIQDLQDRIDALGNSYDRLGKEIEKSYSTDTAKLYGEQNKMLEQQKKLIEQQIAEEEDKKDTDDDRIKQWKEELQDINDQIEENKEAAKDAIFGEDLQSAIENLSSAWADAWTNGTNRVKSVRDVVRSMMQKMVEESINAAISASGAMEQIREKMEEFYADGIFQDWEQEYLYKMAEDLQKDLDKQFGWAGDSLYKDDSPQEQQSATRGFSTEMTQDQASELSGRFTAVAESNLRIEGRLTEVTGHLAIMSADVVGVGDIANDMRDIIANSYIELQQISENTGEIIKPIKQMQLDIAEVKRNTSRL